MMTQRVLLLAALGLGLAGNGQAQAQGQYPAQAPQLGRLFSTPDERAALDAQRGAPGAVAAPAPPPVAAEPAPPAPPLTLNGIVKRSSGKSTVWLNQVPQDDQRNVSGVALSLRSASGHRLILKPGQSVDLNDGSVREAHER